MRTCVCFIPEMVVKLIELEVDYYLLFQTIFGFATDSIRLSDKKKKLFYPFIRKVAATKLFCMLNSVEMQTQSQVTWRNNT